MGCEQSIQTYDKTQQTINAKNNQISRKVVPIKSQDNCQNSPEQIPLPSSNIEIKKMEIFGQLKQKDFYKNNESMKIEYVIQTKDIPSSDIQNLNRFQQAIKYANNKNLNDADKIAYELFSKGFIIQAIDIYKKIISIDPKYKEDFEGLGSSCFSQKNFQWFVYEWYNSNIKEKNIKDSVYDALSLCYNIISKIPKYYAHLQDGKNFYLSLINKYPQNHRLLMGYANILQLTESYDYAIEYYDRVNEKVPDFIMPYICRGWIYATKKLIISKAAEQMTKLMKYCESNPYAAFILAKNEKDSEKKIELLAASHEKYPYFGWIMLELSSTYSQKNPRDFQKAIEWRNKYNQLIPINFLSWCHLGTLHLLNGNKEKAKQSYFKAMQIQSVYYQYYKLRQLEGGFDVPQLKYLELCLSQKKTDKQIQQEIEMHPEIKKDFCFWLIGSALYNKAQYKKSFQWCQKAIKIEPNNQFYWWTLGNAEYVNFNKASYLKAIQYYSKCTVINPFFHRGYSSVGMCYQTLSNIEKALQFHRKAAETKPHDANLHDKIGLLEWSRQRVRHKNWTQVRINATKSFRKVVQLDKYNTKAMLCAGTCYFQIQDYKNAYLMFSLQQKCRQFDPRTGKIPQNIKQDMKWPLQDYKQNGETWMKIGMITQTQKAKIQKNMKIFQQKVTNIQQLTKNQQVSQQKIFKEQIINLIVLLTADEFKLQNIEPIFQQIQKLFHQDQQYFHIIAYLLIIRFRSQTQDWWAYPNIMELQEECRTIMKKISQIVAKKQNNQPQKNISNIQIKLTESIQTKKSINLFKQNRFFHSYELLYAQIIRINEQSKKSFQQFKSLVNEVNNGSNGHLVGISTKIPQKQEDQFRVFIRIMQKMFKNQFKDPLFQPNFLDLLRRKIGTNGERNLNQSIKGLREAWRTQINYILNKRFQKKIETSFEVSDLLRAKCMFNSLQDLAKAVKICDSYCKSHGYEVIQLDNRLTKPQTLDVVYKIQIKNAVCEFQLAMKQDQGLYHLDHCVYQILRSPFGSLYASYIYLSKEVKYPFTKNCKDIIDVLKDQTDQNLVIMRQSAEYVYKELTQWKPQWQKRKERNNQNETNL